jgi:hypothetical protein
LKAKHGLASANSFSHNLTNSSKSNWKKLEKELAEANKNFLKKFQNKY